MFDRKTVFIGSFNLDPRSMNLDTEIVLVVQSPQLAAQFLDAFATDFAPENAWRIADVVGTRTTSPGSPSSPRGRSSSRTIRPARGGASSGRSSGSCPSPPCSEERRARTPRQPIAQSDRRRCITQEWC